MKFGVVVFPGSNCDLDAYHLIGDILQQPVEYIRHDSGNLGGCDVVILPGGFSYGDYLRSGAIARFSKVMEPLVDFARGGGIVLGICNGFQILTESGLLPGALYRNRHLQFRCENVWLRVESSMSPFTRRLAGIGLLKIPIAHGEGSYYAPPETVRELESGGQVLFRYVDHAGKATEAANPNGSVNNIAGICNKQGNVVGMMPHPERAGEKMLGSEDGLVIFRSLLGDIKTEGTVRRD